MSEVLSAEEIKKQMVVLKMEAVDKNGSPMTDTLIAKHQNNIIRLTPGKNSKQITREAANHIIQRAKNWDVKPVLKIIELKPADEIEPDAPESNAGGDEGDEAAAAAGAAAPGKKKKKN